MYRIIVSILLVWIPATTCPAAEQKKSLGPVSCTIPNGWLAMRTPEGMLRFTTPEGPSGLMLLVGSRPKNDSTIEAMHKAFSTQFKKFRKDLDGVVGKALIGKRRFSKEDLVDPKVEIVDRNGTKVVHFRAAWNRSKGEEVGQIQMTESFFLISGERRFYLTVAGPMYLFETYKKDIKKIVGSLKIAPPKQPEGK